MKYEYVTGELFFETNPNTRKGTPTLQLICLGVSGSNTLCAGAKLRIEFSSSRKEHVIFISEEQRLELIELLGGMTHR